MELAVPVFNRGRIRQEVVLVCLPDDSLVAVAEVVRIHDCLAAGLLREQPKAGQLDEIALQRTIEGYGQASGSHDVKCNVVTRGCAKRVALIEHERGSAQIIEARNKETRRVEVDDRLTPSGNASEALTNLFEHLESTSSVHSFRDGMLACFQAIDRIQQQTTVSRKPLSSAHLAANVNDGGLVKRPHGFLDEAPRDQSSLEADAAEQNNPHPARSPIRRNVRLRAPRGHSSDR